VSTITPLVLTFDEAPNIGRCLDRLTWASRVIVLDSGSTDETAAIVRRYPNAELHVRAFDDHASQWNHGLDLVETPWVLALDADYVVSDAFVRAAADVTKDDGLDAAYAPVRYCIFGRPLSGSLYPPRALLFRRSRCRYRQDGHTQVLDIRGRSIQMSESIAHDDRKSLARWFASQAAYTRLEADKLTRQPPHTLSLPDRVRLTMVGGPPGALLYTLFVKGTILDGWPGWYYTLQRTTAEIMLSLALLDRRLRG